METSQHDYDYVIIGSGFGGSVSALRLSEKGYKVLVIEKGKWFSGEDFPKSNWRLNKWLWMPALKFFGLFKMTFFRHVTVFSGVGVGGGSLVYANTLPVPKKPFFESKSWSHLADWHKELKPFYKLALFMLGAGPNPKFFSGDQVLKSIAEDMGKEDEFHPTNVAVYFGEPKKTVADPFFGGKGPERTGCHFCGGCMLGCQHNSKNTLDKNYLYFAQEHGAKIQAESLVYDVKPLGGGDGADGYEIHWKESTKYFPKKGKVTAQSVIFAGGVLGTIDLLLDLKKDSLPNLSQQLGNKIRTNSESLLAVVSRDQETEWSKGVAIGAILDLDEHSHLELVRYPKGSGFFRTMLMPAVYGKNVFVRLFKILVETIKHPLHLFKVFTVRDFAKSSQVLLFMQTLDSTLRFTKGIFGMSSKMSTGEKPTPFIPLAYEMADKVSEKMNGKTIALAQETLTGIASTAHILGGATMGADASEGVIDKDNFVFGYQNMMVCDGSIISANIGVNPSLTITALTERAMAKIPPAVSRPAKAIGYSQAKITTPKTKKSRSKTGTKKTTAKKSKPKTKAKTKSKAKPKAKAKVKR